MSEGGKQKLHRPLITPYNEHAGDKDDCMIMEDHESHDNDDNIRSSASSLEDSRSASGGSTSSSDIVDDASSSTSCSSSSLMGHLPIKLRGLSEYYEGKSQSFTSLSRVMSIEDLAKKETPYRRKMKACKSYGGSFDAHKPYTLPKATISKKSTRASLSSLSFSSRR